MKAKSSFILITALTLFMGCKSKVKEKELPEAELIEVTNLSLDDKQVLKKLNTEDSPIDGKYYALKACLVERARGTKLNAVAFKAQGLNTRSLTTDSEGCFYWEHKLDYDYTGKDRCHVFKKEVFLTRSKDKITLHYSIDTYNDQLSDLNRSQGCQFNIEEAQRPNFANKEGPVKENHAVLGDITPVYAGLTTERRGDLKVQKYDARVSSCLSYKLSNTPITHTRIKLTIKDQVQDQAKSIEEITDNQGCFSKIFNLPYEQYSYSHWEEKSLEVEFQEGPLKGSTVSRKFYLNPWETERFLFGHDERLGDIKENPIKENNRLHIDGVMYIQIGNDIQNFKVNDQMGLTISKSYQVILNPKVDRGHLFSKNALRYTTLRDGKFKLKFMLLAPDGDDIEINEKNFHKFTYMTGAEKIVEVKNGLINTLINLPMKLTDLPRLAKRVVSILKIEPLSEIGLKETVVTGFFKAKIAWIKTNVIQSKILQTNESELRKRYDEKAHAQLIEKIQERITSKSFDPSSTKDFGDLANFDEDVQNVNDHQYKKHIENLLSQLSTKKNKESKFFRSAQNDFQKYGSKEIFKLDLKKRFKGIKFIDTHEELYNNHDLKASLDEHGVLSIFNNGIEANQKTNLFFKLACRKAFPKKKYSSRVYKYLDIWKDSDYKKCIEAPAKYFESTPYMHSKKINQVKPLYSNGFRMSVGSRFSTDFGSNQTEALGKRVGADIGGNVKTPLGGIFGAGAGVRLFDISYSWQESWNERVGYGDEISTQEQIMVENFKVEVKGQFDQCVLVKSKDYLPYDIGIGSFKLSNSMSADKLKTNVNQQYYLCTKAETKKINEDWYFLQSYIPGSTLLRDPTGPTEVKLLKVIRGKDNYNEFEKIFRDKTKVYLLTKESASQTPDVKLFESWGHLTPGITDPKESSQFLLRNIEGSFPGTIQVQNK